MILITNRRHRHEWVPDRSSLPRLCILGMSQRRDRKVGFLFRLLAFPRHAEQSYCTQSTALKTTLSITSDTLLDKVVLHDQPICLVALGCTGADGDDHSR